METKLNNRKKNTCYRNKTEGNTQIQKTWIKVKKNKIGWIKNKCKNEKC